MRDPIIESLPPIRRYRPDPMISDLRPITPDVPPCPANGPDRLPALPWRFYFVASAALAGAALVAWTW